MKKSQNEIWESKLKWINWYRFLMIFFLIAAIISSTFAIIKSVQFNNYKNTLEHPDWISVVIETKKMPDSEEIAKEYQLKVTDYGGAKVQGDWKGQTLDQFLHSLSIFHFASGGYVDGIKGSEKDSSLNNYWWALYSPTDPSSIQHPEQPSNVGAPSMYLQNANVFYFALYIILKNQ